MALLLLSFSNGPSLSDLLERRSVEAVKFVSALPLGNHETDRLQYIEML
jgi:hypothetical protein